VGSGRALFGTLLARQGIERVHHHVPALAPLALAGRRRGDHRIGAQAEAKTLAGTQLRGEGLVFQGKEVVRIGGRPSGEGQERTRPGLPPQEVALPPG
jgi:hypothetical protein